ncbi:hypothetical protein ACT3R3_15880, partial [Glutamicibacter sp. AOP5-B1-3]
MKEIDDADLIRLVVDRFREPGRVNMVGPCAAEIDGSELIIRYPGVERDTGKFKSVVTLPDHIGDEIWNEYVDESSDISYWVEWAVFGPVEEAYMTGELDAPADSDGYVLLPIR